MKRYTYLGPVYEYERIAAYRWHGETTAPSIEKARSNLAHQYKKSHGLNVTVPITLPGTFIVTYDPVQKAYQELTTLLCSKEENITRENAMDAIHTAVGFLGEALDI